MSFPPAPKKAKRSQIHDESIFCEDDDVTDSPYTMYFVRLSDSENDLMDETEKRNFLELFQTLTDSGIMPEWMDGGQVFEISSKNDYFVVPVFRGSTFRRLWKEGFKVYGPPIVAECLQEQKPLPRWEHPVFSSVFEGTRVCFTSILPEERKVLSEKVRWMNGIIAESLYREVTHLVAAKADNESKKYKAATRCGILLMKEDWIEEIWENTQAVMGKFRASEKAVIETYKLPIFYGTEMTVTKIDGIDRTNLFKLVEEHGGKISGSMVRKTCTHLVSDHIGSEKYKKATEWGTVKIVQTRWVRKCIEVGYLVDEVKYHPKNLTNENFRSSTPQRNTTVQECVPDVSSISGPGGRLNVSMNASSVLTPTPLKNIERMNRIFERPNNSSIVACTMVAPNADDAREGPSKPGMVKMRDPIDDLCLRKDEDLDIFEGCMIWLCGVEGSKIDKWRKLLDHSGATRVQKIDSATHVVVVSTSASEKSLLRKYSTHPNLVIVNAQWIVECFQKKMLVPYEDFEWCENIGDETVIISNSTLTMEKRVELSPKSLSRYSEEAVTKIKGIFAPFTFFVHLLSDKLQSIYVEKIRKNGGIVVDDGQTADYCVYGHSVGIDMINSIRCGVTSLYIDTCIGQGRMLEISSHALFVVLPCQSKYIFENIVFLLNTSSTQLKSFVTDLICSYRGVVVDERDPRAKNALIVMMERMEMGKVEELEKKMVN